VKGTNLKKPAKTPEELESAIRTEMEDICEWPTGLAISVVPHEDSWKVVIMTEGRKTLRMLIEAAILAASLQSCRSAEWLCA
jgi:hypothetical protein